MTTDPPAGWKLVPVEARQLVRRIRERCAGKLDQLDYDLIDWLEREPDRLAAAPEPPTAPLDAERVRRLEDALRNIAAGKVPSIVESSETDLAYHFALSLRTYARAALELSHAN